MESFHHLIIIFRPASHLAIIASLCYAHSHTHSYCIHFLDKSSLTSHRIVNGRFLLKSILCPHAYHVAAVVTVVAVQYAVCQWRFVIFLFHFIIIIIFVCVFLFGCVIVSLLFIFYLNEVFTAH